MKMVDFWTEFQHPEKGIRNLILSFGHTGPGRLDLILLVFLIFIALFDIPVHSRRLNHVLGVS